MKTSSNLLVRRCKELDKWYLEALRREQDYQKMRTPWGFCRWRDAARRYNKLAIGKQI